MNTQGLEAAELSGDAAVDALTEGLALAPVPEDELTEKIRRVFAHPDRPADIPPAIARSIAWFAPAGSAVRKQVMDDEAAYIRADLAYNEAKNSGVLLRGEIERAQAEERKWGVL